MAVAAGVGRQAVTDNSHVRTASAIRQCPITTWILPSEQNLGSMICCSFLPRFLDILTTASFRLLAQLHRNLGVVKNESS